MSEFQELEDFERRLDTMCLEELRQRKKYWMQHAQQLASKVLWPAQAKGAIAVLFPAEAIWPRPV